VHGGEQGTEPRGKPSHNGELFLLVSIAFMASKPGL
jgi:hypothetical protein